MQQNICMSYGLDFACSEIMSSKNMDGGHHEQRAGWIKNNEQQ
jgi:very-short-patch-repair endonuclease